MVCIQIFHIAGHSRPQGTPNPYPFRERLGVSGGGIFGSAFPRFLVSGGFLGSGADLAGGAALGLALGLTTFTFGAGEDVFAFGTQLATLLEGSIVLLCWSIHVPWAIQALQMLQN